MSKMLAVLVAFFAATWFAAPALAEGTHPSTGYIEICKYATGSPALTGTFHFTVKDGTPASVDVEVGHCSTPIQVSAATTTVAETAHPWYEVVAQNYVTSDGVTHVVAQPDFVLEEIPVTAGDISKETVVNYTNDPVLGNLEVCKTAAATSGLTGTFTFAIGGDFEANIAAPADVSVAVGKCSLPFAVPAGKVTVTENSTNDQSYVTDISVQPETALVGHPSLVHATADVTVAPGPTGETMVTFENSQSSLKLCKLWGDETPAPTAPFTFTVSADGGSSSTFSLVADDPASCVMVPLRYRAGSMVTITEGTFPGTYVKDITLNDQSFGEDLADLGARTVTFPIHAGMNDVTFVNDPAPAVPLKLCKLGTVTGPFSFTVSPAAYTSRFDGLAGDIPAPTTVTVPAPNQCAIVGWYPYDQTVTITEAAGTLTKVTVDLTSAAATLVGTPNLTTRTAMVLVGNYDLIGTKFASDWAIVDFTNGPAPVVPSTPVVPATPSAPPTGAPAPAATPQLKSPIATPASTSAPTVKPTKVAVLKVASARIVKVGAARFVVVRVNGAAKSARIHVALISKQHKVAGRVTRYVATNKAVRVGNLRLAPSILGVRVSL